MTLTETITMLASEIERLGFTVLYSDPIFSGRYTTRVVFGVTGNKVPEGKHVPMQLWAKEESIAKIEPLLANYL